MSKQRDRQKENIFLRERVRQLEAQLRAANPSAPRFREVSAEVKAVKVSESARVDLPERESMEQTEKTRRELLSDLRKSLLLTLLTAVLLLGLWRWGDQLFQYLPFQF